MIKIQKMKASISVEYMALIMFVIGTLIAFGPYIVRGFAGRWKAAGDMYGYGKQYDPRDYGNQGDGGGTLECFWDEEGTRWIVTDCYETLCDCTLPPEDPDYTNLCTNCKNNCSETGVQAPYTGNGHMAHCRDGGGFCSWVAGHWVCP